MSFTRSPRKARILLSNPTSWCVTLWPLSPLSDGAGSVKCPIDPYFILPDRCVCVDFQTLRLQESPDAVPHGEMPRHLQLYCDR